MTKKRAERLTGYEVREPRLREAAGVAVGAFEGERLVVKAVGRADFLALRALVHAAYFSSIAARSWSSMAGAARGAGRANGWRFIIASIARMAGRTGSRTWSRSAGTATS